MPILAKNTARKAKTSKPSKAKKDELFNLIKQIITTVKPTRSLGNSWAILDFKCIRINIHDAGEMAVHTKAGTLVKLPRDQYDRIKKIAKDIDAKMREADLAEGMAAIVAELKECHGRQ